MRAKLPCILLSILLASAAEAGELTWLSGLGEATKRAAAENRYILVDLYADWCGWCHKLEKQVFSTPAFADFAADFVLLKVDIEDGGDGGELNRRFGEGGLPTTLILDARQTRVGAVSGFAPAPQYIKHLQAAVAQYDASLKTYEQLRRGDDRRMMRQMAEVFHRRGDGERAAVLLERMRELTPVVPSEELWLQYMLADSYRLQGAFPRAEQSLTKARSVLAGLEDRKFSEQLDMLGFYIAQDRGDCQQALDRLKSFIVSHPRSEMRWEARRALERLQGGDGKEC